MKVKRTFTPKGFCDEIYHDKEYKTFGHFIRAVKLSFDKLTGIKGEGEDMMSMQAKEWNGTLLEVLEKEGSCSYDCDGFGFDIRYPDFIYMYEWTFNEEYEKRMMKRRKKK